MVYLPTLHTFCNQHLNKNIKEDGFQKLKNVLCLIQATQGKLQKTFIYESCHVMIENKCTHKSMSSLWWYHTISLSIARENHYHMNFISDFIDSFILKYENYINHMFGKTSNLWKNIILIKTYSRKSYRLRYLND